MTPRLRSAQTPYSMYQHQKDEEAAPFLTKDHVDPNGKSAKPSRARSSISFSQAFVLAAASASFAAIVTAIAASYTFSHRGTLFSPSTAWASDALASLDAPRSHPVPDSGLRSLWGDGSDGQEVDDGTDSLFGGRIIEPAFRPDYEDEESDQDGQPKVVWLISFPNSGTSYTLHLTRESSNTTTATNYGLEGDIRDKPSVPALTTSPQGPFLELIPNRHTTIPKYILTKTHCGSFCTDCEPHHYLSTPRDFQVSCQTGKRAIKADDGSLKLIPVTYNASLVKKAVHVIRHPLDNAVARFHLTWKQYDRRNDKKWTESHPYGKEGFAKWCREINHHYDLAKHVDKRLASTFANVPCYPEFFRYAQWHNLAFTVGRDMGLPTLVIHYSDYRDNVNQTISRLLNFLELPRANGNYDFSTGKEYHEYYTPEERLSVRRLIKEYATAETWHWMKDYDFS